MAESVKIISSVSVSSVASAQGRSPKMGAGRGRRPLYFLQALYINSVASLPVERSLIRMAEARKSPYPKVENSERAISGRYFR